jgi:hypothetical protein
MKHKTLYIIAAVLALLALFGISQAKAEQIVFKNKCGELSLSDPAGYDCYNKSQGADNAYRLAAWLDLKRIAKRKGIKIPRKVVLIDPQDFGGYVDFVSYKKGSTFYFAAMQPCQHINRKYGLEALSK